MSKHGFPEMSLPNEDVPERQREQSGDNDANTQCLTVIDWNVVSCPKEVEAGQAQHPEVGGEEAASGRGVLLWHPGACSLCQRCCISDYFRWVGSLLFLKP